jgi:hypothetical protein
MEDGSINAKKLRESVRIGEYVYESMDHQPSCFLPSTGNRTTVCIATIE